MGGDATSFEVVWALEIGIDELAARWGAIRPKEVISCK